MTKRNKSVRSAKSGSARAKKKPTVSTHGKSKRDAEWAKAMEQLRVLGYI